MVFVGRNIPEIGSAMRKINCERVDIPLIDDSLSFWCKKGRALKRAEQWTVEIWGLVHRRSMQSLGLFESLRTNDSNGQKDGV